MFSESELAVSILTSENNYLKLKCVKAQAHIIYNNRLKFDEYHHLFMRLKEDKVHFFNTSE